MLLKPHPRKADPNSFFIVVKQRKNSVCSSFLHMAEDVTKFPASFWGKGQWGRNTFSPWLEDGRDAGSWQSSQGNSPRLPLKPVMWKNKDSTVEDPVRTAQTVSWYHLSWKLHHMSHFTTMSKFLGSKYFFKDVKLWLNTLGH